MTTAPPGLLRANQVDSGLDVDEPPTTVACDGASVGNRANSKSRFQQATSPRPVTTLSRDGLIFGSRGGEPGPGTTRATAGVSSSRMTGVCSGVLPHRFRLPKELFSLGVWGSRDLRICDDETIRASDEAGNGSGCNMGRLRERFRTLFLPQGPPNRLIADSKLSKRPTTDQFDRRLRLALCGLLAHLHGLCLEYVLLISPKFLPPLLSPLLRPRCLGCRDQGRRKEAEHRVSVISTQYSTTGTS